VKIENDESIVMSTPIHIEEGLMPYRYVLRHVPDEVQSWVSHRENMKFEDGVWKHLDFYWGHYFFEKKDAEEDFRTRK
jgi:hypothetical protein